MVEVLGECKDGVGDRLRQDQLGLEVVRLDLRAGIALCRGCAVPVPWYPQTGHVEHELLHLTGQVALGLPGQAG